MLWIRQESQHHLPTPMSQRLRSILLVSCLNDYGMGFSDKSATKQYSVFTYQRVPQQFHTTIGIYGISYIRRWSWSSYTMKMYTFLEANFYWLKLLLDFLYNKMPSASTWTHDRALLVVLACFTMSSHLKAKFFSPSSDAHMKPLAVMWI